MSHPMYTHYGLFYSKIPALQDKKYGKITQFLRKNLSRKKHFGNKKEAGLPLAKAPLPVWCAGGGQSLPVRKKRIKKDIPENA